MQNPEQQNITITQITNFSFSLMRSSSIIELMKLVPVYESQNINVDKQVIMTLQYLGADLKTMN